MDAVFHAGELAVQRQANVQHMAARVGNIIKPTISLAAAQFLAERPFAILASIDSQKRPWASILVAEPAFMQTLDEKTVQVNALPTTTDPLLANLQNGTDIGLLAIDFGTRQRMRLNGTAVTTPTGFTIQATQVYGNCPKYIQERYLTVQAQSEKRAQSTLSSQLSAAQRQWIATADTFFIASAHPEKGADGSHRGGNSGFVHVQNSTQLIWPDYAGNMMFNTLGNIAANPKVGLLFLDFDRNHTLQLTGRAEIVWDKKEVAQFVGAERLVTFAVQKVIETQTDYIFEWTFGSYSPHNPS